MSLAAAMPGSTGAFAPVASSVRSAGAVTSGTVVSVTVTVCVALPALPAVSVTLQMTVCAPTVKGPVTSGCGVRSPSTISVAVAAPGSTPVAAAGASRGRAAGGVTTGGGVLGAGH